MDKKTSHTGTKQQLEALWDCFVDVILDPLLFAFGIFILFARIQNIIDYLTTNPPYSFWTLLEIDIRMNPGIYIGFFAVYLLWAISKAIRYRREKSESKKWDNVDSTLEKININLSDLQKAITDLPDKIAESIKSSKNAGNKSK